ncbi:hypothetical protein TrCOL_g8325 [Triparma columacea]|uniref:Uncharacterized protein n=1 Tax=Triparma columacea TaxID=722753 RepID=A0A9W7G4G8_9STRA|nr:hypothetical protein TrCOL_g8325 [Triparma columacea]
MTKDKSRRMSHRFSPLSDQRSGLSLVDKLRDNPIDSNHWYRARFLEKHFNEPSFNINGNGKTKMREEDFGAQFPGYVVKRLEGMRHGVAFLPGLYVDPKVYTPALMAAFVKLVEANKEVFRSYLVDDGRKPYESHERKAAVEEQLRNEFKVIVPRVGHIYSELLELLGNGVLTLDNLGLSLEDGVDVPQVLGARPEASMLSSLRSSSSRRLTSLSLPQTPTVVFNPLRAPPQRAAQAASATSADGARSAQTSPTPTKAIETSFSKLLKGDEGMELLFKVFKGDEGMEFLRQTSKIKYKRRHATFEGQLRATKEMSELMRAEKKMLKECDLREVEAAGGMKKWVEKVVKEHKAGMPMFDFIEQLNRVLPIAPLTFTMLWPEQAGQEGALEDDTNQSRTLPVAQ